MSVEYPEFLIRSKQQKRFIHSKQDRKSEAVQIQIYGSNLEKKVKLREVVWCIYSTVYNQNH